MAKVRDSPVLLAEACRVHHFRVMSHWSSRNLPRPLAGTLGPDDG